MKTKRIITTMLASLMLLSSFSIFLVDKKFVKAEAASSGMTPSEYDAWTDSWDQNGHLYIHYNRGDKEGYEDFCVWLWQHRPKDLEGSLWAFSGETKVSDKLTLKPMSTSWMTNDQLGKSGKGTYIDEYGVIADIDLYNSNLIGGKTGTPTTFKGATNLGFLMVRQDSMDGTTNWTSDGGKETYLEDFGDPNNWRGGYETGSIHVYISTGDLKNYKYSVSGGVNPPKVNPVEQDTSGIFSSKVESISDTYGNSKTSDSFKELGVGYQIFVASFRDSNGDGLGDIRGIIDSLDYLKDLGVEVLWLTPIQQSDSYHGYDISDYYAVDPKFGTIKDYRELIYKAHENGMKVLMDLVLNHTSKSNVWFTKSQWAVNSNNPGCETDATGINWRDVYTWKYKSDEILKYNHQTGKYETTTVEADAKSTNPSWYRDGESSYYYYGKFGSGMPEINFENTATRKLINDMVKYWLSFGLDGFRLDAVKHIYMKDEVSKTGNDIIITDVGQKTAYDDEKGKDVTKDFDYSSDLTKNVAWWKEFANDLKNIYPQTFLVGENFDGWGTRASAYYQALDSQFSFSTYYHIPAYLYANGGGASNFSGQAAETFVPYSQPGPFELAGQNMSVPGGKRSDFIDGAFTSNHDVMRAINHVNGTGSKDETTAKTKIVGSNDEYNKAKIHAAVTLLNPGVSWIYYGDELGMSSNTDTHVSKYGNENSVDIWYRQPFIWEDEKARPNYQAGQYTFEYDTHNAGLLSSHKGISLVDGQVNTSNEMYQWYKDLIEIKKLYPKGAKVDFTGSSQNVLTLKVTGEGKEMRIFINIGTSTSEYLMNVPNYNLVKAIGNVSGLSTSNVNVGACTYSVVAFQAK